ncbi:MAG: stage II sporulation protein M [Candidatus Aenigmarchaeota archaeon]|nr:stage II sporulation protein M [Candidatus Aenigmarchaeota archaeon]
MVLESIINPKNAEDKPHHIFIIAFLYTIASAVVSQKIFPNSASILTVSFVTILFVPFFQKLFSIEEEKEKGASAKTINLFVRHKEIFYVFSTFFLGVVVAMTFMYIFMPSQQLFSAQSETIRNFGTGKLTDSGEFSRFFLNNTQVMIAMFFLSFAFGAGAVFILAWNASVIALYLGLFIQSSVSKGVGTTVAFIYGVPVGLGTLALHGIPEVSAYFIAGLAGGLLSVGIIREKIQSKEFRLILKDSLLLLILAEFLISVGAYIEAAV